MMCILKHTKTKLKKNNDNAKFSTSYPYLQPATPLPSPMSFLSLKSLMSLQRKQGCPRATKGIRPFKRRSSASQFFYLRRIYGVP